MTTAQPQPDPAPITPPAQPSTSPPLSPLDREKLAFYLGASLEPQYLTREDIDAASLEAWAKSPTIAPHIHGFHYINSLSSSSIHRANYIGAQLAVREEFRAAKTSTERLRAISAFIRLSNSRAATLRAKKSSAKPVAGPGATTSPRPIATTLARRREIERQHLDSLGLLPRLPDLPRAGAPQPTTHTPNPGTPAPGSSHPTPAAPTTTAAIGAPNPGAVPLGLHPQSSTPVPTSPAPHAAAPAVSADRAHQSHQQQPATPARQPASPTSNPAHPAQSFTEKPGATRAWP